MKILFLLYVILIKQGLKPCKATNTKLLELEPSSLSNVMKEFMIRVIKENCHEKNGFLFVAINKVESEYSDFAVQQLGKYATVIVINFNKDEETDFALDPNYFKFGVTDPEDDVSYSGAIFERIKVSRARVVLILTKKPLPIIVDYILNSYYKVNSINILIAYEDDGKIEIITYNPYLPSSKKIQNLTYEQGPLFYDKTKNLYGSKIKCLLTHRDRTKIHIMQKSNEFVYGGKDYIAIHTLLNQLNGKLQLVPMDNMILNPWFESVDVPNRTHRKLKYLDQKGISVLIKSEQFTVDGEILDNLYPHAQNDLCSLVPKSSAISMGASIMTIYTTTMWIILLISSLLFLLSWIIYKKLSGKIIDVQKLCFDIYRMMILNTINSLPRNYFERTLIVAWIFNCFIGNMFLQSKITSFFTIKKYYPEINTVEELFSSGLPLYSIHTYILEVKKKYVGTEYEAYAESLIPLASNEGLMDQMIYRTDAAQIPAFLTEHDIAKFVSRYRHFRENGAPLYHLVKESIIPNYQAYKVVHNSPLLPILNKKLRRLGEAGFIELWAKWNLYNATLDGFLYPEENDETTYAKPVTLEMSAVWFLILIFSHTLATLVFIIELLVGWKRRSTRITYLN